MSNEIIAILPGADLPGKGRWQDALTTLGLPWRFAAAEHPAAVNGFYPMQAGEEDSGVEILHDTLEALPGHLPVETPHRVIVFRWGGDLLQCACALSAAAGLAEAFGAAIHDPAQSPTLMDVPRLQAWAADVTAEALAENSQPPKPYGPVESHG